ncbi:MAG TPA: ABC transporter permease [Candidatus Limnocylindria bacterium]|nr:ABC transporter permease [Candidatus Limnocylindria bacterium]
MTSYVLADSATMLRRNFRHAMRYPSMTLVVAAIPILFYLIFVYVFGSTLGNGLPGSEGGRDAYIAYVTPGVLLFGIIGGTQSTAITVSMDMTTGIISRFRTMSIPRGAVLAGHVIGSVVLTMLTLLAVLAVALITGFRPTTGPIEWLAAIGFLAMISFALAWLSVGMGLVSKTVEAASNLPMPLILLPFFSSAFVPTDSMPGPVAWFAENQPFTPFIETLRGLMLGTPIGSSALISIAWCAVIALGGYLWSMRLYNRDPIR